MEVKIRNDCVILDGYVNAVERYSKPLLSRAGRFIEKILPNAFKRALARTDNVLVLLNHDYSRELASTKEGTAKLYEDNIGLRAKVVIKDKDVVEYAKTGRLRGWSFGFSDIDVEEGKDATTGLLTRAVKDLVLYEVSIINDKYSPAYVGTSVEVRAEGEKIIEYRGEEFTSVNLEVIEEKRDIDYSDYEKRLEKLKDTCK